MLSLELQHNLTLFFGIRPTSKSVGTGCIDSHTRLRLELHSFFMIII